MSNPQFNSTGSSADIPLYDFDPLDEESEAVAEEGGVSRLLSEGQARRQLEDRQEAQKLRRLLSDYAWDDREI